MWTCRPESSPDGRTLRYSPHNSGWPATHLDVIRGWQSDPDFRAAFNGWLTDAPFKAFRWETPALTGATADRPFEFVLLDAPGLTPRAEPGPFAEIFEANRGGTVVTTRNLGGDATLVVPCPLESYDAYAHLADFVRWAPPDQIQLLWQEVGHAVRGRMSDRPLWLSTAGMGVAWLHVRIDDRPKYYGHGPYRPFPMNTGKAGG